MRLSHTAGRGGDRTQGSDSGSGIVRSRTREKKVSGWSREQGRPAVGGDHTGHGKGAALAAAAGGVLASCREGGIVHGRAEQAGSGIRDQPRNKAGRPRNKDGQPRLCAVGREIDRTDVMSAVAE